MRIRDVNNNVDRFYAYGEERDEMFNPQAVRFAEMNKQHYANGIGIIEKPAKEDPDTIFANKPTDDNASAGYRGLQRLKKLAGLPYDKKSID